MVSQSPFYAVYGIKNGSRLLSKRQNPSGSGAELLLLWEKRSKKILHCAAGWRFGMESSGEMGLLHHHSSKRFDFILRNCPRSEPSLSCSRYPFFLQQKRQQSCGNVTGGVWGPLFGVVKERGHLRVSRKGQQSWERV